MARPPGPALLPVFRSRLTGDLLAVLLADLLADPKRTWKIQELADRTGTPYQAVTGEVRRLEQAGLVAATNIGRSKLVTVDVARPYIGPLTEHA